MYSLRQTISKGALQVPLSQTARVRRSRFDEEEYQEEEEDLFPPNWQKNVSIGAKWKERMIKWKKHKVVQAHQRWDKEAHRRG